MFRTDIRFAQVLSACLLTWVAVCPVSGQSQTIAEIAERQRAKLLADAIPAPQAPSAASTPSKPVAKARPTSVARWKLHGIYGIGDQINADILNGDHLERVKAGSTIGHYSVVEIGLFSMQLQTSKGCGRKCPTKLTVALGGAF